MARRTKNILWALLLVCFYACSHSVRDALDEAGAMMDTQPEKAMEVLENLQLNPAVGNHLKARYGILLSMAYDKSYRDIPDTSLIQFSYDYYGPLFGFGREKMLSAYYLGIARENLGQAIDATILFREAERMAEKNGDYHYMGLSCEHLSALYTRNYDNDESIAAARKAVRCFQKAGELLSADFSRVDVARRFFSMQQYASAERIVDSLLVSGTSADSGLRYLIYLTKADLLYYKRDYIAALSFYEKAEATVGSLDLVSLGNVAILNERQGYQEKADSILSQIASQCATSVDSAAMHICRQQIAFLRGNTGQAYDEVLKVNKIQDQVVRAQLDRSITHAQKNYFEQHYNLEQKNRQLQFFYLITIILFLSTLLSLAGIALFHHKKRVILEMTKVSQLTKDLERIHSVQKGNDAVIISLLQDKIKYMQTLAATYFSWSDEDFAAQEELQGKFSTDEILSSFRKHLRKLRNDDSFIPSLEKALDISSQNLIYRLRNPLGEPVLSIKMKEQDIQYLTLFLSGFSTKSISFIMDSTEDAVRARKSRYRKLFYSLGDAGKEYLDRLK